MSHQAFNRLWVEIEGWGSVNTAEFLVEPQDKTRDFISSLSKRWNFNPNDVKAVQKVLTEGTRIHGIFKASVGCTQHSDVNFNWL